MDWDICSGLDKCESGDHKIYAKIYDGYGNAIKRNISNCSYLVEITEEVGGESETLERIADLEKRILN